MPLLIKREIMKFKIVLLSLVAVALFWFFADETIKVSPEAKRPTTLAEEPSTSIESMAETKLSEENQIKEHLASNELVEQHFADIETSNKPDEVVSIKEYEGDWCNPYKELSAENRQRFREERKEWSLDRGVHFIRSDFQSEMEPANNELIAPYQEMEINDLRALAINDDKLALSTLLQRQDVDEAIKPKIARHLAALGDTSHSFSHMVVYELYEAKEKFAKSNKIDRTVKKHLIKGLSWVELGLERKDPNAFSAYLTVINSENYPINPDEVLADDDLNRIANNNAWLKNYLNEARDKKNLPPIESIELPDMADKFMMQELAIIHDMYEGKLNGSRIVDRLSDNYFENKECLNSLIAFY